MLVVALAIFHRPLFFEGTRYFIVRAAKQQHLDLSYDISGSIFTTLSVSNLQAIPTEPGPIQRLEIGMINLRYSLIGLIRDGLPGLLQLVDARNVYIEITPGEPLPPEKEKKPQQFKFPALFPESLNIENLNFIARGPKGNTELAGLFLSLLPDRPGSSQGPNSRHSRCPPLDGYLRAHHISRSEFGADRSQDRIRDLAAHL